MNKLGSTFRIIPAFVICLFALNGCNGQSLEGGKKPEAPPPTQPDDKDSKSAPRSDEKGYAKAEVPEDVSGSWLTCVRTNTANNSEQIGCGFFEEPGKKYDKPIESWKMTIINSSGRRTELPRSEVTWLPQNDPMHCAMKVPTVVSQGDFVVEASFVTMGTKHVMRAHVATQVATYGKFDYYLGQPGKSCSASCTAMSKRCVEPGVQFAGSDQKLCRRLSHAVGIRSTSLVDLLTSGNSAAAIAINDMFRTGGCMGQVNQLSTAFDVRIYISQKDKSCAAIPEVPAEASFFPSSSSTTTPTDFARVCSCE